MYKEVINRMFNSVFEKKETLIKALLGPLILLIIIEQMAKTYAHDMSIIYFLIFCTFLININIAVTTHRILLIENNPVPKWGSFKFGMREFKFSFYSIIIAFIAVLPSVMLGAMAIFLSIEIAIAIGVIFIVFILARLSLVLPSIAIDKDAELIDAWVYSGNFKILTMVTVIIIPVIVFVVVDFVYGLVIGFLVTTISSDLSILYSILSLFINVFVISALSSTYNYIQENYVETCIAKEEKNKIRINAYDDTYKVLIPTSFSTSFDSLKEELNAQYELLGFTHIVIDKENSWMIKNPHIEKSYISLSLVDKEFKVESFNTVKPNLNLLKSYVNV